MRLLCLLSIMLGTAVNLNGTAYLVAPHLSGSETVTSYSGTSTPTISAGQIDFTAGTCWDLILSDGTRYPFSERAGIKVHDASGTGNHAYFMEAPSNLWATPDNDFVWELDHGANPALYCDGSGSLEVSTPSADLTSFTIAARVTTAKPATGIIAEYQETAGSFEHADHLLSGVDLRTSWQWIIQTFDSNTGTIYVDDSTGSTIATTTTSPTFSASWFSGMGSSDDPFYLQRLLVYSRAISSGERTALFSAGTVPASGILLDYNFTHSTADPVKDWSGLGNTGAGMADLSIANIPALAANNGVDAMGQTVLNPEYTRAAIKHHSHFRSYEEPIPLVGDSGECRWYVVRTRNYQEGKAPSPESIRVVKVQF